MPRVKQLTEKQKLRRDLDEHIRVSALRKSGPPGLWETEHKNIVMQKTQLSAADLKRRKDAWREMGLPKWPTTPDEALDEALAALNSKAWKARLAELDKQRSVKKTLPPTMPTKPYTAAARPTSSTVKVTIGGATFASTPDGHTTITEDERNSVYWQHALLMAQQAVLQRAAQDDATEEQKAMAQLIDDKAVKLIPLPPQNGADRNATKEQQAEARRMYRWLWKNFPGQLQALKRDPELRMLIRLAGGVA